MKEILFVAGAAMLGYWVYLQCQEKNELKPLSNSSGNQPSYTTPPASAPLNGSFAESGDNFPESTVQRFDASDMAMFTRPITTIKVGINEPTDAYQIK